MQYCMCYTSHDTKDTKGAGGIYGGVWEGEPPPSIPLSNLLIQHTNKFFVVGIRILVMA